jgi:hypothetical protein
MTDLAPLKQAFDDLSSAVDAVTAQLHQPPAFGVDQPTIDQITAKVQELTHKLQGAPATPPAVAGEPPVNPHPAP